MLRLANYDDPILAALARGWSKARSSRDPIQDAWECRKYCFIFIASIAISLFIGFFGYGMLKAQIPDATKGSQIMLTVMLGGVTSTILKRVFKTFDPAPKASENVNKFLEFITFIESHFGPLEQQGEGKHEIWMRWNGAFIDRSHAGAHDVAEALVSVASELTRLESIPWRYKKCFKQKEKFSFLVAILPHLVQIPKEYNFYFLPVEERKKTMPQLASGGIDWP